MTIYVETLIQANIEDVWRHTQTPELHARWDLRFTDKVHPRPFFVRHRPRPVKVVPALPGRGRSTALAHPQAI